MGNAIVGFMKQFYTAVYLTLLLSLGCETKATNQCAEGFERATDGNCRPKTGDSGVASDPDPEDSGAGGSGDTGDTGDVGDTGDPLSPPDTDPGWTLGPDLACDEPFAFGYTDESDRLGDGEPWASAHSVQYGPAGLLQDSSGNWAAMWQEPDGIHWKMLDGTRSGSVDVDFSTRFIPFDMDADGRIDLVNFGLSVGVVWGVLEEDAIAETLFTAEPGEECGWIELIVADFTGDGLADILAPTGFECRVPVRPELAIQTAPGVFGETVMTSLFNVGATLDTEVMDLDGDGDLDAYLCNDFGPENGPNQWLMNDGDGTFSLGVNRGSGVETYCMSSSAADLNHDGLLDFFIAGIGDQFALLQDELGYVDYWSAWGLPTLMESDDMPWGGAATDLNNDGLTDLLLTSSTFSHFVDPDGEPAYVHLQTASGVFEESGAALGFPQGANTRGLVARDVNDDGVLDVLIADYRRSPWLMLSNGCTAENWLAVEAPLGTVVQVFVGDEVRAGLVTHHQGYSGFGPVEHHMGLGGYETVDRVVAQVPGVGEVHLTEPFDLPRRIRWAPETP